MKICLLDLVLLLNRARLPVDLLLTVLSDLRPATEIATGAGEVSGLFTTGSGTCVLNTGAGIFNTCLFNTARFLLAGVSNISWTTAAGFLFSLFSNS